MSVKNPSDEVCINTIRVIAAEMVQKANSGHPGAPMGLAPVAHTLFSKVMKFNPANPKWWNRDRFVLSNGHACALVYTMLHLTGYDVSLDDLKNFRQLHSKCPGHPESFRTPGVEVTTGPLGQGIANAVGFAVAESHLASIYNKEDFPLIDNHTFVVCGDGCLQEGVAAEAISLAGTMKLGKLTLLYDDNSIQIDGSTEMAFNEDIPKRFESMGWHVLTVADGDHDVEGLQKAVEAAKAVTEKPSVIIVKTTIGFASKKQGTEAVHGAPLGDAEISAVKAKLGFNPEEHFAIPSATRDVYDQFKAKGAEQEAAWAEMFAKYTAKYPTEAAELKRRMDGALPSDWASLLPKWANDAKADATRNTSGKVLNALAPKLVELVGGSADLTPSNKTWLDCSRNYEASDRAGRYIRFGVREHAMAAIGNGLSAYGGFIPFTATFLNFVEYALGAVRLSALSEHQQLYIMTHDSIGLGEDGPTHQPIEAVNVLRAMPHMLTFRPADANEVAGSYGCALQHKGPSVLCLSRQNVPMLPNSTASLVTKGAYVVSETPAAGKTPLVLIGTGSEVEVAQAAAKKIAEDANTIFSSVKIVSCPCRELFDQQSVEYRKSVLTPGAVIVSVEAAAADGWEKYSHEQVAMTTFGESAPTKDLYKFFGFTGENVAKVATEVAANFDGAAPAVQATYAKTAKTMSIKEF